MCGSSAELQTHRSIKCLSTQVFPLLLTHRSQMFPSSDSICCCLAVPWAQWPRVLCLSTSVSWECLSRNLEKIHLNRSSAPSAENTAPQQRERGKGGQVVLGLTRLQICWWKRSAFPSATRRKKGCTRVLGLSAPILIERWSRCDNEWITDLNYKTPLYLYHYLKHKIARCCMYSGEWTFLKRLAFRFL